VQSDGRCPNCFMPPYVGGGSNGLLPGFRIPVTQGHNQGRGCAYGFSASICGKIEMAAGLELKILLTQIKIWLRKILSFPPPFERIAVPV